MARNVLTSADCTAIVKKALTSLGINLDQLKGRSPEEIAKIWRDTYTEKHGISPDEKGAKLF